MPFGYSFHKRGAQTPSSSDSPPTEAKATEPKATEGVEAKVDQLKKFKKTHQWDYNLDNDQINRVNEALGSGDAEKEASVERQLLEEDSPYLSVRSAVRNYDVDVPANTIRAWVVGMIATTIVSAVNMLLTLRNPSISIQVYVVQLLAYPVGVGLARVLPNREYSIRGHSFNLNPGPFNLKEHAVIVMMANASTQGGVAYATDVLLAQQIFYKQSFGWAFQLLLTITTQCLGFGLAGVVRRFLVWPAAMIWPSTLANAAMMLALHDHGDSDPTETNGWRIGRYRYFLHVMAGSFVWYWFPGWIAQGLSYFDWIVWMAPTNTVVNQLFGNVAGFGLIPITFDWTIVTAFNSSPLPTPLFAIVNTLIGIVIFFLLAGLGMKYTGVWYSDYLPIASQTSFDNTGHRYNVSRILTPGKTLDVDAYKAYSPLFLGTFFTLSYGVSFAALSAVIVHTVIFHSKELKNRWKFARNQDADVHLRLMRKYRDTPSWWYQALFVVLFSLALFTVLYWDTKLTWWAMIIAVLISVLFLVPIGMIQAVANTQLGLNVLTEFMVGYMLPGRPLAMMLFKTYGYITMAQALFFLQDMKLGHYLKVPPRVTFMCQVVAVAWSSIVQVAVMNWALGSIDGVCTPDQPNGYTCPGANVFFTASVIWGVIGPGRIFGVGGLYAKLNWFWLVGAALPVVTYFAARRWPRSPLRKLHWPVVFGGSGMIPPATVYVYLCWGLVGIFFNGFLRRRFSGWWAKYNYITSAALDTGLFLSTLVIFFALIMPKINAPQWFMNPPTDESDVTSRNAFNNLDNRLGPAIQKRVAPGETFGPMPSW